MQWLGFGRGFGPDGVEVMEGKVTINDWTDEARRRSIEARKATSKAHRASLAATRDEPRLGQGGHLDEATPGRQAALHSSVAVLHAKAVERAAKGEDDKSPAAKDPAKTHRHAANSHNEAAKLHEQAGHEKAAKLHRDAAVIHEMAADEVDGAGDSPHIKRPLD